MCGLATVPTVWVGYRPHCQTFGCPLKVVKYPYDVYLTSLNSSVNHRRIVEVLNEPYKQSHCSTNPTLKYHDYRKL